ncbi:MAG: right-handed parallel beta-helix repeat-containing protein [Promethearchaeota archaeon]
MKKKKIFILMLFLIGQSIIIGSNQQNYIKYSNSLPKTKEDIYKFNDSYDQAKLFEKDYFTYPPSYARALNDPISINSNEDLEILKLQGIITGEGTEENPYILEDLVIDTDFSGPAIFIENTDAYLIIRESTILNSGNPNGYSGVYLSSCSNIKIMNCHLDNNEDAIFLDYNSFNNTVINNTILNSIGFSSISINGAHHNQILNNFLEYSENYAMNLWESENNVISGNIFTDNYGGIQIEYSNSNIISENEIPDSVEYGIKLYSSNENIITRNILVDNMIGIYLWHSSSKNIIYFNDIYGKSYTQAYEDISCADNLWNNGTTGNYWNNGYIIRYPDATHDGTVWDTPYEINGEGLGIDHFPLVKSINPMYESPIGSYPMLLLSILCITSIAIVIEIQRKKRERGHI